MITEAQEREIFKHHTGKEVHSRVARHGYLTEGAVKAPDVDMAQAYPTIDIQSAFHRSPEQAGSADRYYGRPCDPNFSFIGMHFGDDVMSEEQRNRYRAAWEKEEDRKKGWKK